MTDEILNLGSQEVIVHSKNNYVEKEPSENETALANVLYEAMQHDQPWCRETMKTVTAAEFVTALQLMAEKYIAEHDPAPFVLDAAVVRAAYKLSLTHRLLAAWVMEVRVGLLDVWAATKDLVTVSFVTPPSGIAYTKRTVTTDQSHPVAVLHVSGTSKSNQTLAFRGYRAYVDREGNLQIGQRRGNVWFKNGWLIPGIRHVSDLVEARSRGYLGKLQQQRKQYELTLEELTDRDKATLTQQCRQLEQRITSKRSSCVCEHNFSPAQGRRLDLENVALMTTFLAMVRSIRAKALYERYDRLLDRVADETNYYKTDLINNPSLAGSLEATTRRYIEARDSTTLYHHYVGELTLPDYYAGFSPTTVPATLRDVYTHSLEGVDARCVSMEEMFNRADKCKLMKHPAMLYCLEDFTIYLTHFGQLHLFDKQVVEYVEEFRVGDDSYDSHTEATAALADKYAGTNLAIQRHVALRLAGEDNIREMTAGDFRKMAKFKLIPQVLVHRRDGTELVFFRDGVYVGISQAQVHAKFKHAENHNVSRKA